ncbi:hypothetical protein SAPIO_CDS7725 [Scedosporium apiospermum]|uniref:F-box domain-containing protein n=1 Tax=Pseudallescheria apiosperma TaxID=563466 RepID=A0A084G2J6_PSEDA|nr:uncharacterized protein SAPIO_CDS7725 [Scedosporium apiospermum]KEZ41558.1 hypothetical protein SAPIO_CDS7725 [Scedosporium apiospermum]
MKELIVTKSKKAIRSFKAKDQRPDPISTTIESDPGAALAEQVLTLSLEAEEQKCDSRLESLPPEVRRHLLSILDFPQLQALVHASPTFHHQYLFDRNYVLSGCLRKTLGSAIDDAYAVYMFAPQHNPEKEVIAELVTWYSEQTPVDKLPRDAVLSMVTLYSYSVKPISEHFACWMLDDLTAQTGKNPQNYPEKVVLTSTETMRLARAIYRFQLFCELTRRGAVRTPRDNLEARITAFFDMIEPWGIEELFSFYKFVSSIYDKILDDIRWDLHPDNPKFDDQDRPPTPTGAFEFDSEWDRGNYLEGLTLRGLPLLHEVMFNIKDHEDLVTIIQEHMWAEYIPVNRDEGLFGGTHQEIRYRNKPSKRDQMQEDRVALPFRGDGEPHAPPLAWTIIWGGTYSTLVGCYIPEEIQRWGYVFWDAATMERTGAAELLKKQWRKNWDEDEDPRDEFYFLLGSVYAEDLGGF